MTTPTVTISVSGVPITATTTSIPTSGGAADATQTLYMMYVQATKDEQRYQWVVFPPARAELGVNEDLVPEAPETVYMLSRVQRQKGNRSKWFHHRLYPTSTPLAETVASHAAQGFEVGPVVAVPLEDDDYQAVWNTGETPHKALRAVDRALNGMGLSVK